MEKTFSEALIWHMDSHKVGVAELSRGANVSLNVIKKLRTRRNTSTNAETALAIAGYFGKTLPAFLRCEETDQDALNFEALLDLLTSQERELLHRQIRGMLSNRAEQ